MRLSKRGARLMVCLTALLALVSSVRAANPSTGPADGDDIQTPRRMLAAAQDQMDAAQHDLETVHKTMRPAFEASAEFIAAQTSLRDAQAAKTAAAEPVLTALRQRDDYKNALDARSKAAAAMEKFK